MFNFIVRSSYLGSQYLNNYGIEHPIIKTIIHGCRKVFFLNQGVPILRGSGISFLKKHAAGLLLETESIFSDTVSDIYSWWDGNNVESKSLSSTRKAEQVSKVGCFILCKEIYHMSGYPEVVGKMICPPICDTIKDAIKGSMSVGKTVTEFSATIIQELSIVWGLDVTSIQPYLLNVAIHTLKSTYDFYSKNKTDIQEDKEIMVKGDINEILQYEFYNNGVYEHNVESVESVEYVCQVVDMNYDMRNNISYAIYESYMDYLDIDEEQEVLGVCPVP